ncbi:MAG: oligosaccharide flippase family protein [candidate division WWE3 bacterium]|nr:oligosaccharide flippase family protein [candidate division WWE3 bacterium]
MTKDLLKWQSISVASRFFSVGVGIAQSIILTRWILSVEEFGLIGVIGAVGAMLGVFQHLGLASGTTRELAYRGEKDASKVFISSLIARYAISLPLAIGLFIFAGRIAAGYHHIEMAGPLQIYAVILLLQASQDVCGSVLQGLQRFKHLFLFQAFLAILSFCLYVPLSHFFKFNGYFLALSLVTLVSVVVMWVLVIKSLRSTWKFPTKAEVIPILKDVFAVGLSIYIVKIIFTNWENLGTVFLGTQVSLISIGFFTYAMGYAFKLMTVSDALTDVNLSVMTKLYKEERDTFKQVFMENFNKIYSFVWLAALTAIFWAPQIFFIFVKHKYDSSLPYILPLTLAVWFYSYINYLGASIIVPAKKVIQMIIYYVVMIASTVGFYFMAGGFINDKILLMSIAMAVGSGLALIYQVAVIRHHIGFWVVNKTVMLVTLPLLPLFIPSLTASGLTTKILLSAICYSLFFIVVVKQNVVTKAQINKLLRRSA